MEERISSPQVSRVRHILPWVVLSLVIGFLIGNTVHGGGVNPFQQFATRVVYGKEQVKGVGQLPPKEIQAADIDFREFWDLWQLMKTKYYQQPVSDRDLFYGAMSGLAASVGDPYTTYFEPKNAEEFEQSLSGQFQGIGAEIGVKDDQLQIIAPLPDTPAERAGLLAGDLILKIDGQDTTGMSADRAVTLIRGNKGTKVTLSIMHDIKKPPMDITITRDIIQVKSVRWKMLPDQIASIEITSFSADTSAAFQQALKDALRKDPKGIVLDLRNNPGGFLDAAVDISSEWLGRDVVVKERRQGKIVQELHGTNAARIADIPTIILVNQGSASASEIVAGALQDAGKARLVGTKTFGKGSVQDYQNLQNGSAVKITIAEWLTPKGRTINKTGLEPDVRVERTPEDYAAKRDPQLERALQLLTGKTPVTPSTSTTTRTTSP